MNVPKDWAGISIKTYLQIHNILTDKTIDIIDSQVELVAVLTGQTAKEIEDLDIVVFKELVRDTQFIFENNIPKEIPLTIEIDGVEYLFDFMKPIKKAGDFIDISHLTKKPEDTIYNIHKIMAVLCKPLKEQSFEERCDIFYEKLTIDKAYPIALFFWTVFQSSLSIIQNSLDKQIEKNLKVMEEMVK